MARRISTRNRVGGRRVRSDISINRCPPGQKWVPGYRKKDGTYVRGHCAKISGAGPSKSVIQKETSTKYGWDRGPVWIKENKTTEKLDNNNESSDDKQ